MEYPNEHEAENLFAKLAVMLQVRPLYTESGITRFAAAGEFMLMGIGDKGEVQFKHSYTRNYVFLLENGELLVPMTRQAFMQGFFDAC